MQRVADSFTTFEVGEWPFSASCGERLFLSVSDISTDSVAEFDSCDYERQQADNLRNVHCRTSVRIVEPARPLSRWERSALALPPCPIRLSRFPPSGFPVGSCIMRRRRSVRQATRRAARYREVPICARCRTQQNRRSKGKKIICDEIVANGMKTSVSGISRTAVRT